MTRATIVIHPPVNAPEGTVAPGVIDELKQYEARILAGEGDALRARWDCGRRLLPMRVGARLPNSTLSTIAAGVGVTRQELGFRMRFAERFPNEKELATAVASYPTWSQIRRDAIASHRAKPAPKPADDKVIGEARLVIARWRKEAEKLHGYGWDEATKRAFDEFKADLMRIQEEINAGPAAAETVAL